MSRKYRFHNPTAAYFISFATVEWVDLFTREEYFKVLTDCVRFCRKNNGMELFAYCFMPNHFHMLFRSKNDDPSGLIREFKGYTSKQLIKLIKENPNDERRDQLLEIFARAAAKRSSVKHYQVWQHNNQPIEVYSTKFIKQKVNYIHMNPLDAGLVRSAWDWKYNSIRNYTGDESVLEIDLMDSIE